MATTEQPSLSFSQKLGNRLRSTVDTIFHSYDYARYLVRGNRIRSQVSWAKEDAPPVVLVHGFLGTRGTMLPLTRRLQADGRIVFSYAYGAFQIGSMRASAEDLSEHLRMICEDLHTDKVDIIGYSMGGLVGLHAIKFLQAQRYVRRMVTLGSPFAGAPLGVAGVLMFGALSPSVWQVLPGSHFLHELTQSEMPKDLEFRQIHASNDAFCREPGPIPGVRPRDYMVLPGGHSSLVIAPHFYEAIREFLDAGETTQEERQRLDARALTEELSSGIKLSEHAVKESPHKPSEE